MTQMTYEQLWNWYGKTGRELQPDNTIYNLMVSHSNAHPGIAQYEVDNDIPLGQTSLIYVYETYTGKKLEVVK